MLMLSIEKKLFLQFLNLYIENFRDMPSLINSQGIPAALIERCRQFLIIDLKLGYDVSQNDSISQAHTYNKRRESYPIMPRGAKDSQTNPLRCEPSYNKRIGEFDKEALEELLTDSLIFNKNNSSMNNMILNSNSEKYVTPC